MLIKEFISETNKNQMIATLLKYYKVESVKVRMKSILNEIQSGEFAREWIAENDEGLKGFHAQRKEKSEQLVETVGEELRGLMPWLKDTL